MSAPTPPPRPRRAPARAWLRPVLLVIAGLAVAAALVALHLWWGGILLALLALLMGYWTSPVRGGQHVPFAEAVAHRSPDRAIILWAPGDPMSARLQTAVRGERPDVSWVNIYRDAAADEFLLGNGGHGALPLVMVGDRILRRATVGEYLDAREDAERETAGWRGPGRTREPDGATDPTAAG